MARRLSQGNRRRRLWGIRERGGLRRRQDTGRLHCLNSRRNPLVQETPDEWRTDLNGSGLATPGIYASVKDALSICQRTLGIFL